ncbi:MAG TPA: sulfotransferase [Thermoanaerobaculia bacterium]|nr:sulfotransferase [Thermoanaerobaculia bacterium]
MSYPLVIGGMHRSGTSLVASVLQKAGLAIGCDVAAPGLGNPRGHFEDPDFLELHEEMLAAEGESCFSIGENFVPPVDGKYVRRAEELIAARRKLPLWGWKDPRICLFLEFWETILPEARYLFLYRHPVDVALSLWRRNGDLDLREAPWRTIRSWEVYNRRLLEFRNRHPERCFLAQVPALSADLGGLVRRLRDELDVPLDADAVPEIYAPEELTPQAPSNPAWESLIPDALELYRRLDRSANLAERKQPSPDAETPPPAARDLVLLRASETLLYALLEKCDRDGAPATSTLEQRKAYHRIRMEDEAAVALEFTLETGPPQVRELTTALLRERERIKELIADVIEERERCAAAEARGAALGQTLAGIERSWSFAPTRFWWWLRKSFGGSRE